MSQMQEIFRTNWLAARPVFYNEISGKASNNINDVIDVTNFEFHPEGFNNYLDFGYSVFEQTPLKHVKYLRHSSRLLKDENGKLEVEYFDDPAEQLIGRVISEKEIWERLEASVQEWESRVDGEIVVPTSGGFDSRLMNYFLKDKSRIRAFTFGVSEHQEESHEVVRAKTITDMLGIKWRHIELSNFHDYFDLWDEIYGLSTHSHGMHQIEFFNKIRDHVPDAQQLLSGIIGDGWAGGKKWPEISKPSNVVAVGLSHGMNADSRYSLLPSDHNLRDKYFHCYKEKFADPAWVIIESMRFKLMLLCYLIRVPEYFGFSPWTPFFDIEIALGMLALPLERRFKRAWQIDFLRKNNIYIDEMAFVEDHGVRINHSQTKSNPLSPLNRDILREVIRPRYIDWINRTVEHITAPNEFLQWILSIRKVGGALRMMGINDDDPFVKAYCAYLTLKPIENLLKKRGTN